MVKQMEDTKE